MRFAFAAIASIFWSIVVMRWSVSGRHSAWTQRLKVVSAVTVLAVLTSIAGDLWTLFLKVRAVDSGVAITITDMGGWWQLAYRRGSKTFITANELHVPASAMVILQWRGAPMFVWRSRHFLTPGNGPSAFIARESGVDTSRLIRLWPPTSRRLRIIADSPVDFERWFANEARPASLTPAGDLFVNSGCGYCHVIRGVAEEPWKIAPELTHFAERRTIGGIDLPNRTGSLTGWVVHSHALKPSSEMPQNRLDPVVLHQLVGYLESLR